MKILILHNRYQHAGGEDAVVAAESALLRGAGYAAHVETVSNDAIAGLAAKAGAFWHTPHDPTRMGWMRALIARHKPDVLHIHNFFPLLTPAVHEAAAEAGVAVVQTLHNYRLICAGSLLMRGRQPCEKCVGGSPLWGMVHRCYRGSLPGSLAVVRMQQRAKRRGTWRCRVHRFIALTEFAKEKFIEGGLPAEKIAVKPNFVAAAPLDTTTRQGALFVGRLSPEKGVDVLIKAWGDLPHVPLSIIGDGPERARLEAAVPGHVRFFGRCAPEEVRAHMARAQALIMPSLWYETFGMTMIEAFSCGLPVIASRLGAMAELIEPGKTGLHFAPGDAGDLAATVRGAFADPARLTAMGESARQTHARLYTPEKNLALLEAIYRDAIAAAHAMRAKTGLTATTPSVRAPRPR